VGLQFLLTSRIVRYGQERRGEVVPDGAGFLGASAPAFLYDAKAYSDGYEVGRDSIRQFADYVRAFHAKYEVHLGRAHAFLVISGHFKNDASSMAARSQELYAECQAPLVFLRAAELGRSCALLAQRPAYRTVLNWRVLLSRPEVTAAAVQDALGAAERDRLVR
jgi:hypothetical protein